MPTYIHPPESYAVMGTTQVAKLMGVQAVTVARWVDGGDLRATPDAHGRRRVARDDLIAFINAKRLVMPTCLLAHQAELYFAERRARR